LARIPAALGAAGDHPRKACGMSDYRSFLKAKIKLDEGRGFDVGLSEINPALKDFTRASVQWLLAGGCRALFSSFGLHKTVTALECQRLLLKHRPGRPKIIVCPLGVRQEFMRDAARFFTGEYYVTVRFIRTTAEIDPDVINLTNYESVRDRKIDLTDCDVWLDEASILRGFGGTKTFREFMRLFEHTEGYRFVATATPSPNEYIELLAYAAFLGIMDVGQGKTRFFKRNSEKADTLTIHPHKEREFWLWVASWALFVQKPSDLGFSDDGYELPALDVRWHEIPTDHRGAGAERDGQVRMFRNAAIGVQDAAREKRDSLKARIDKLMEIRSEDFSAHRVIWHDLEDERRAIERACPAAVSVYGSQDLDEREVSIRRFSDGEIAELAAKPVMLGSGVNFQRHCAWGVYLGIGFKFNDLVQSIHRLQRFGQPRPVRVDLIYTSAEREVRRRIERRWQQHDEQRANMAAIIREFGLSQAAMASALQRSIGTEREEASGEGWRLVKNDSVEETARMEADSVDLIVTSIPFSTQYEYSPSYNDFGHTDDDRHFFEQMDFLTAQLWRVLKPGRVAAIHVKDRIVPSGLSGLGFQTVSPFSDHTVAHFQKHGFGFLARKTVVTDVVRENNQTYRLGWTEQCKDGSRMGAGMPEYVLLFRKPPTDRSNGYADEPVVKAKKEWKRDRWANPEGYSRGRWQLDAHGYMRSSGSRLLTADDLKGLPAERIYKIFRAHSLSTVYDFEQHVAIAEGLEEQGKLPPTFMLLPPQSHHSDVWTDITRMRTLNGEQYAKGRELHLCPLQFDIVDRLVVQFSEPGELVFDPFAGLGTVPLRALKLGRRGLGCELSRPYWLDGQWYLRAAEREMATPSLFDLPDDDDKEAA
jgi:DNA modification methylase